METAGDAILDQYFQSNREQRTKVMSLKLKIAHKGLILVLVPLIIELSFVVGMAWLLREADHQALEEWRNGEIIAHITTLSRLALDGGMALIKYKSFRRSEQMQSEQMNEFDEVMNRAPAEFTKLRQLVRNEDDRQAVNDLENTTKAVIAIMNRCKRELAMGDRLTAIRYGPVLLQAGSKANETFANMVGPFRNKKEEALQAQARNREFIWVFLKVVIIFNVGVALLLAMFFSKGITSRLRTLTDNSLRLAKGQPLNPIVGGADEITGVDKDFHKMADQLTEAMSKLRASEERTRLVIEHMPVGVITIDGSGIIESINPRTEEIFVCSPADMVDKRLDVMFPGTSEDGAESFVSARFAKAMGKTVDAEAKRTSGERFPAEISVNKFQTLAGDRYLVNVQDATERHEIERLKQEFVAMVSHDLRTPLTSVQGTLTLLGDGTYGELTATGVKRVRTAEESIDRLINLINDLLDIEKLEAGKLTMKLERVSLSKVIEQSVEGVRGFGEKHHVTVETAATDLSVRADRDRLVQVLINLLSNAIKFSPEQASVTVVVEQSDGYAWVKVIDRGRGVPASHREAIFERFKQVEAADGARKRGTGLGLAICKAIIEAHDGAIGVDSEEGKGSTFWLRLPV